MSHRDFEYEQLTDLVSGEIERQLRDRTDVVESMKSQMSKVLREFEDLSGNLSAKRTWMKSVNKNSRDIHPTNPTVAIHPLTTTGNIVTTSPTATSPSKLPTLSGLKARSRIQQKINRNVFGPQPLVPGEGVPSDARSPDGKISFDKKLPRVAHMEKKYDGMQTLLATQQKHHMYDRALVRYPQCRSKIYAPSIYDEVIGSINSDPASSTLPQTTLELDFVYGVHNGIPVTLSQSNVVISNSSISGNVVYVASGDILWYTASLIVLYTKETNTQRYFREHTNEVTSVALHPNQHTVASGQAGRETFLLVWDTNDDLSSKRFVCLKGHTVAVRSISFSHDGKLVASLGGDIYNTICIHDWREQSLLVTARGHSFRVHTIAFNPFQAYGRPETKRDKKPGQALQDDDVCYTLVSCGVRHIRFWTLTKTNYNPPNTEEKEEFAFFGATFGGPARQHPLSPHEKVWKLEGNIPSLNGKLDIQDFTCLTFVDDSPPLYVYNEESKQLVASNMNDRTLGRIIAGTARGDLCVFWQPRKTPDVDTMKESDTEKEPAKWWEIPNEYSDAEISDLVLEKFVYEPTARLVEVVPHDQETGNKFKISKQAQLEIDTINKRLLMKQMTPALHARLAELKYNGPFGHQGCTHQLAFCKKNNMIISSGSDGRLILWKCAITQGMRVPGVSTQGVFTPLSGTFSDGMHSLTPLDTETKVYVLPSSLPGKIVVGPPPKPTSLAWKEDGKHVIVGTSTSCIWELNIVSGEWTLVFEARTGLMISCATHPTREEVATLCQDGCLTIWDLRRHVCIRSEYICITNTYATAKATCMEFHPSGEELLIGLNTGEFLVVAFQDLSLTQRKSIKPHTSIGPNESTNSTATGGGSPPCVSKLKYSPDGKLLAVGARDTFIYLYQASNGYKKLHVCEGHSSAVMHLTWGVAGDVLQSNASDGEVLFWSISVDQNSFKQITDSFQMRDVQWSQWTSVFGWATPGIWSDDTINLVDIAALVTKRRLSGGNEENGELELNGEEELVAVANRNTLRLFRWPALRGAKGKSYHGHSSLIVSLGFSNNGQYLLTIGGEDSTLIQWKVISGAGVGTGLKRKQKYGVGHSDDKDEEFYSTPVPPSSGKHLASPRSPRQVSRQYRESNSNLQREESDDNSFNASADDERTAQRVIIPMEPLSVIAQVRAKHDFAAENEDELSMKDSEIIRVLSKENGDWWLGENSGGKRGIFPSNFVEDVPDEMSSSNEEGTHELDSEQIDL